MATKKNDKLSQLAINGGKPVFSGKWPAWPQFNPDTDKVVLDILHSGKVNYWTGQAEGEDAHVSIGMKFEREWAKWLGVKNAISVTNGTAALHTALGGLGIAMAMLSHLLGISPIPLMHGFLMAPTSVTTLVTEERAPGEVWFRCVGLGDTSHLYAAGEHVSYYGRFHEIYGEDEGFGAQ